MFCFVFLGKRARQLDGGPEQAFPRHVPIFCAEEQGLPNEKNKIWNLH